MSTKHIGNQENRRYLSEKVLIVAKKKRNHNQEVTQTKGLNVSVLCLIFYLMFFPVYPNFILINISAFRSEDIFVGGEHIYKKKII